MTGRQRVSSVLGAFSLAAGIALIVAALGIGANSSRSGADAQRFRDLRVVLDTIDYLDPAQAYSAQSWWAGWGTWGTLLTYPHRRGRAGYRLVPGLAAGMPRVSRNGRVYSFRLRPGLRYSNGRPVRASDFNYSIERLYRGNSQGVGFFLNLAGAERFSRTLRGNIAGVATNNARRTVTFRLVRPRGDFLSILALQFAAPVPTGTPAEDQSTRGIPSTGPYRIVNYTPEQGFTMLRNRYFRPTRSWPRPNPDRISVRLIGDANAATQRVVSGQADYTNAAIPPDRIGDITRRFGRRLKLYAGNNTYYFWMNTRSPVFRRLRARQAVNHAINRRAMIRAVFGGLGRPTQNILPPTYPSYRRLNLYPYNLARARRLVRQAGVNGARITVWGRNVTDSRRSVELLADALERIGFQPTIRILPRETYYTTIGNQSTPDRDIGWARWLEDYPHPSDWFDVLLNGRRITAQNNNNYSNANVGRINRLIERLNRAPRLTPAINRQWAQVDRMVMQNALWAPWVNRVFTDFFGARVNMGCYLDHPIYHFDYWRICVR
ncbi:MAG: ABC transporter substrate-binding protein [Actinomycetota bacterium]|nr:ABC transporter substrate-binding protein [Actinomycetota bacterium]